jgi:hypothetical protein
MHKGVLPRRYRVNTVTLPLGDARGKTEGGIQDTERRRNRKALLEGALARVVAWELDRRIALFTRCGPGVREEVKERFYRLRCAAP